MMTNTVEHYLSIYKFRKSMLDNGTINPNKEVRELTNQLVESLS
jgi:hypothetical protein